LTFALPAALGVNVTEHAAADPLAASVQEDPKAPVPAVNVNATEPAGLAPVAAVTVTVHEEATPTIAAVHATADDVAFNATATVAEPLLAPCFASPP
jgi:hypothetical protein